MNVLLFSWDFLLGLGVRKGGGCQAQGRRLRRRQGRGGRRHLTSRACCAWCISSCWRERLRCSRANVMAGSWLRWGETGGGSLPGRARRGPAGGGGGGGGPRGGGGGGRGGRGGGGRPRGPGA